MKSMADFEAYYANELRPVLETLEGQRKRILTRFLIGLAVVLVIYAVVATMVWSAVRNEAPFVFGGVLAAIVAWGWWWFLTHGFVRQFKDEIIRRVIHFVDPQLSYAPGGFIPCSEFQLSTLFKHRVDRYKGEDFVSGHLDKTALRFSEIHAEYKTTTTDSKGRTRTQWHTIFKGLFFAADFNKHFSGRTVVLPDTAQRLFGRLGQKLQEMNLNREDLIKLEDPEFEKAFVVYGSDQVESRYILSTSLMRRILSFQQKLNVPVYIAFVNANVYLAIDIKKNLFEPRVFRTLLDFALVREYLEDLSLAVGIVEDLNLNTRIWTKT